MKGLAARRRNPIVASMLLLAALLGVGGVYAVASTAAPAEAVATGDQTAIDEGKRLYLEGCSSCHGLNAQGTSNGPTLIGVGAAFDFHSGRVRQAPRWLQRSGFEWLFRLCTEPRRLAARYLITNPLFVLHVLLQRTGLKKYPLPGAPRV